MIFGAITNSWRLQLEQGDLLPLIQEAQSRNSKHVELRQTCLGSCETGKDQDWRPVLPNLQSLVDTFPGLSFDLAMALPCLSQRIDPMGEQFQAALEGAKVVGRSEPHLRLVDPTPAESVWESADDIPQEAMGLVDLAREAARQGWPCWSTAPGPPYLKAKGPFWASAPTPPINCGAFPAATRWRNCKRCPWI